MDDQLSAYISGVWHGGLGITLIIFGLIGWPSTRFILGQIISPFARRWPRKPVGSRFWDKYNVSKRTRVEP
ncbi:MAG: hypothetical protein PHY92_00075 [Alphaproteobacteria bacterium]|nr:hypothetical protein [Alphaproteobacteria bacterium]